MDTSKGAEKHSAFQVVVSFLVCAILEAVWNRPTSTEDEKTFNNAEEGYEHPRYLSYRSKSQAASFASGLMSSPLMYADPTEAIRKGQFSTNQDTNNLKPDPQLSPELQNKNAVLATKALQSLKGY
jgi:hypothetical protein